VTGDGGQSDPAPHAGGEEGGRTPRGRLLLAGGLAGTLLLVSAAVLLLGGDDEREFEPASAECIAAWNDQPRAVSLGRHQLVDHGYYYVEVTTLSTDGSAELAAGDPAGACAMVFAASTFARERASVAMLHKGAAGWIPLTRFQPPDRLEALQDEAQSTYNGHLEDDGTISAL
jgi:hypothetical protein